MKIHNGTALRHQSQPTSMTFWTARELNTEEHCLWLAHFFSPSDALSSCVWPTYPVFLIKHCFSVKCHIYSLGIPKPKSRKKKIQYLKTVKLRISRRRKSQLVVSRQVVTNQCCGLAVIFCGFISHLIGRETINIPEIFSGVHGFTGKIVNFQASFRAYLVTLPTSIMIT